MKRCSVCHVEYNDTIYPLCPFCGRTKDSRPKRRKAMQHGTKSERNKDVVRRVLNGETLQAVGNGYGISANRTRLIFYEAMYRMFKNEYHPRESWHKIKRTSLQSWRSAKNYILSRLI